MAKQIRPLGSEFSRHVQRSLLTVLLGLLVYVPDVVGQVRPVDTTSAGEIPQIEAFRVQADIALDGALDEPDWQGAETVSDFRQSEPIDGEKASQNAEVKVLYGANALYVGAILYDEDPDAIEAALGRRDNYNRADWFLVSIDSYFDKKTAYTFGVNAAGVQYDAIQTSGRRGGGGGGGGFSGGRGGGGGSPPGPGGDTSWNAIWYSSQRITQEGWIVEMRIPFSMLRFPEAVTQTWGIYFSRRIPRLGEQSEWPHVPRTERTNLVARFGQLTELNDVKPKRNIQVTPYTLGRLQRNENPDQAGDVIGEQAFDVGGDLKIGLGPNVMLDATINPDFGQVEADPAVLNLTAFETRFQERRPFFLEGMQIFDFDVGPADLPYTRRIGAWAPIIGAVKLSGRTEGGFSFGLLGASTGENFDPTRNYGIARVTQQIGMYSRTGGIFTMYDGPSFQTSGRRRSIAAGIDYDFRFFENEYGFEGFIGTTRRWDTEIEMDSEDGVGGKFLLRKRRGAVQGFFGLEGFSDTYNVNDVGQLRQNNYINIPLRLSYDINGGSPFGPFLRASIGDFASHQLSYSDGLDLGQRHNISAQGTLRTFQQVGVSVSMTNVFGGYDIYETRGQGPWARPKSLGFRGNFGTDSRRNWSFRPGFSISFQENGGEEYGLNLSANVNAGSRLMFSCRIDGEWENQMIAWSSNESFLRSYTGWLIGNTATSPDNLSTDDFTSLNDEGQLDAIVSDISPYSSDRYYIPVFGARDTRSIDVTFRSTITFTPNLSLEVYSQLFLARGRYDQFQLLQNRDELVPFDAFPKRDEFAFSNLQSNVVLRWEYRPGSTLFVVWTHSRHTDDTLNPLAPWGASPYDSRINDQITQTFDIIPTNVFLVKLKYTFLN